MVSFSVALEGHTVPTDCQDGIVNILFTGNGRNGHLLKVHRHTPYLNTVWTCSISSGPMPSAGVVVTVCRPPYLADGGILY